MLCRETLLFALPLGAIRGDIAEAFTADISSRSHFQVRTRGLVDEALRLFPVSEDPQCPGTSWLSDRILGGFGPAFLVRTGDHDLLGHGLMMQLHAGDDVGMGIFR